MKHTPFIAGIVTFLFTIDIVFAQTTQTMVVNSNDWRDLYLATLYSAYKGYKIRFITNLYDAQITSSMFNERSRVIVIESRDRPVYKNYAHLLITRGVGIVSQIESATPYDLQLKIAEDLNPKGYILVNDEFGYDALSVAPYALNNNYWVLFYNDKSANNVVDLISKERGKKIILYGNLPEELLNILPPTASYEKIETGSIKGNNMEIVRRLIKDTKVKWVVLSSGEYFEPGFLKSRFPILLYFNNEREIVEFAKKNNIKNMEVIGANMVTIGRKIREISNKTIGVVVKYGQTFTGIDELRGKVFALKVFPLPSLNVRLEITNAFYDKEREMLLIFIKNTGNVPSYFYSAGIRIVDSNGNEMATLRDEYTHFIYPDEVFVIKYKVSLPFVKNLVAELYTLYGQSFPLKTYLTQMGKSLPPYRINIEEATFEYDEDALDIVYFVYVSSMKSFVARIKNKLDVNLFGDIEIYNLLKNGINYTFSYKGVFELMPGEEKDIRIPVSISQSDINKNKWLNATIYYGRRKDFMINSIKYGAVLKQEPVPFTGFITFLKNNMLTILLIMLIILIFLARKKATKARIERIRRFAFHHHACN
ncbi:MAG: hypothetical protein DRP85_06640 [Candidatus Makaraimicrobium thalassicum]|nr:MAG: hypothetical protein DRP85_06640 [Candidatus Omnitrophota bacterium]